MYMACGAAAGLFALGAAMLAFGVWFGTLMWVDERLDGDRAVAIALGTFATAVLAIGAGRVVSAGVELLREARAIEAYRKRRGEAERAACHDGGRTA